MLVMRRNSADSISKSCFAVLARLSPVGLVVGWKHTGGAIDQAADFGVGVEGREEVLGIRIHADLRDLECDGYNSR